MEADDSSDLSETQGFEPSQKRRSGTVHPPIGSIPLSPCSIRVFAFLGFFFVGKALHVESTCFHVTTGSPAT